MPTPLISDGGKQGDREGRLYYDATVKERAFIVEATLAVALLSIPMLTSNHSQALW
ncbi:MAG TPA: hypothetical protein VFQ36_08990 [Ktedonobacteraceae bacterium]|nr:hypothetical protein [Ktedonobacteraceae bacterium]